MCNGRIWNWRLVLAAVVLWPALAHGLHTVKRDNVRGEIFREDPEKVWILSFMYNKPRMTVVKELGKPTKLYWYLTYIVVNDTGKPRLFVPEFTLVTDTDKVYKDVVVPAAEQKARVLSDATLKYLNSVTIAGEVQPAKRDGRDYAKRGIAIFDSVDLKTDFFSIYVTGLSNGYQVATDPKTKKKVIRRRTLRLKFAMPGDDIEPNDDEIQSLGWEWLYR